MADGAVVQATRNGIAAEGAGKLRQMRIQRQVHAGLFALVAIHRPPISMLGLCQMYMDFPLIALLHGISLPQHPNIGVCECLTFI